MRILFFNPRAEEFYRSFSGPSEWRIDKVFRLLESGGHLTSLPHSRALGGGLFELRIKGVIQIRFFYAFKDGSAHILHGFVKKTEQIPDKEIEYARMWCEKLLY